jgi:hypothetical protein
MPTTTQGGEELSKLDDAIGPLRGPRRRWLCALVLVGLLLGACNRDEDKADTSKSPGATSENLAQYREGSQLPDDWPSQSIPVPAGAQVVASIENATVAGAAGEANTVLYSVNQSVQEVHDFMQAELPKKGWNLLESSDPAQSGVSVTSAEGNGYIGVFTAGEGLAPPDVLEADKVALQIILAKGPPTANPSPEGSPKG